MKIPTQQNNVKRATLVVTGMAVVTGLAIPTVALAHGGDRGDTGKSWHREDRRGGYNKSWKWNSWSWWQRITADDFSQWNELALAKIDRYIDKTNLNVENEDTLRASVDTSASVVVENLTALEQLRDSTGDDATTEEKAALKEQSIAVFSAYYDYKLSLNEYKSAIKAAATNKGVKVESSIEADAQ